MDSRSSESLESAVSATAENDNYIPEKSEPTLITTTENDIYTPEKSEAILITTKENDIYAPENSEPTLISATENDICAPENSAATLITTTENDIYAPKNSEPTLITTTDNEICTPKNSEPTATDPRIRRVYEASRDGDPTALKKVLQPTGRSRSLRWIFMSPAEQLKATQPLLETKTKDGDQFTTPLIIAARNGNLESAKLLLNAKADIEARGNVKVGDKLIESCTPLWTAAANGHVDVVKLLIEEDADIDGRTLSGSTPLMAAAYNGRLDIVSCLVENGADVNSTDNDKNTPLMLACFNGHMNVVLYLTERGANVDLCDKQNKTAIQQAADRGYSEIADKMLCILNSKVSNNLSFPQETLVYEAARDCNHVALRELLRQVSDSDKEVALGTKTKDGDQVTTPLIIAARNGNMLCVQDLLIFSDIEARGTVKIGNKLINGCTPLWTAATNGHLDVVKLLLEENVDVDGRTLSNSTPLMEASYAGRLDIVRCLVENGGDVNACNNAGNTPLMAACINGHINVVEYLIKRGANMDHQDKQGTTAIQHAAERGHSEIADELVHATEDISSKCGSPNLRVTLIYEASRDGNDVALKNLLSQMSETERKMALETKTQDGDQVTTPLIIASRNGNESTVKMLLRYGTDIEARGTVKAGDKFKEGCCRLCYRQSLVAQANQRPSATRNNYWGIDGCTPLCAAAAYAPIFAQWTETQYQVSSGILRCLVANGADINARDSSLSTPLMLASLNGRIEVVRCLIDLGAKIDLQNINGDTALHEAIYGGHVEIAKELSAHGAALHFANLQCLTPPLLASIKGEDEMVECLIKRSECTREQKVETVELLGAFIATRYFHKPFQKAFYYMKLGMEERFQDPLYPVAKQETRPQDFFQDKKECETVEELEFIESDRVAIFMEGLIIGQRILGADFESHISSTAFYLLSDEICDPRNVNFFIKWWVQALEIDLRKSQEGRHFNTILLSFVEKMSMLMSQKGCLPSQKNIAGAFEIVVRNLEIEERKLKTEEAVYISLYLLMLFAKVQLLGKDENCRIRNLMRRFHRINPLTEDGNTLLHLTAWPETRTKCVKDVCKHPCAETMKLIINAGANVNAANNKGETPLHLAVTFKPSTDEEHQILRDMMEILLSSGACEYLVNNDGKTALDIAETDDARMVLEKSMLKLKHLAARAVKQFGLPYLGVVPKVLEKFISMH